MKPHRFNLTYTMRTTFVLLMLAAISPASAQDRLSGECMGTTWNVTISGQIKPETQTLVQAELDLVDRLMSTWKDDSEVSRFNQSRDTDWFDVSTETAAVVTKAQAISKQTKGAFDITVSPLIELWNFEKNTDRTTVPSREQIEACQKSIGWESLTVRADPPSLRKDQPELTINLSAIAKGYAVDRVCDALSAAGIESYLVEVGGEVRAKGMSPRGKPWSVGIEEPVEGRRAVAAKVELVDQAMATSGDYRNFFEVDGKRYSHTIDPRTGRPVEHGLASVSVLASTCMEADAWATAITVLGPKDGRTLASSAGIAVQLTARTSRGLTTTDIGGFTAMPLESSTAGDGGSRMWPVFLAAGIVFLLAIGGMAIGVIISNKRLKGSCGGLGGMTDEAGKTACDLCAMPSAECRGELAQQTAAAGATAEQEQESV